MFNSHTTTSVIALRTTIAPAAPQMMARFCRCDGRLRAAIAITMALSPASTKSITMMASRAERNSVEKRSTATPKGG